MAKKKGRGRHVYFKDATLWKRLSAAAEEKDWSVNRIIENMMNSLYPAK